MFTGIVEAVGKVEMVREEEGNRHITLQAPFASQLQVDQSVAHNGVCLTVIDIPDPDHYTVTAIQETLDRSALGDLQKDDSVNLERCLKMGDRLDGHIVQGHVDNVARCTSIRNEGGSYLFEFTYEPKGSDQITVPKGSITVDGVSLTVVDSSKDVFSVAIIPYTLEHTRFKSLKKGDRVNLEFDIVGKYIARIMENRE